MSRAEPSSALIDAVLQYADICRDLGGCRCLLRLSDARLADPIVTAPLGREAARLTEIAIIYDDEEGEIIRVLDGAHGDELPLLSDQAQGQTTEGVGDV